MKVETILVEDNYMEQIDSHTDEGSHLEEYLRIFLHNARIVGTQGDSRILFYRGQSDKGYPLTPSVFRKGLLSKEHTLISDMMLNSPNEFIGINNVLERLIKMQHYGLPTRLLDITLNPLKISTRRFSRMPYTEANYENAVLEVFRNTLGYDYIYAPDLVRDYADPLYSDELVSALHRVNPKLPDAAITETIYKLRNFDGGSTLQKNIQFMDYLQNGVSVSYYDNKEQRSSLVRLIDYDNVERNSFIVANQWTIVENSEKRPDVLVFVNGLPVVIFELKSPSREETDASEAFLQLRNYMHEIQ